MVEKGKEKKITLNPTEFDLLLYRHIAALDIRLISDSICRARTEHYLKLCKHVPEPPQTPAA